MSLEVKTLTIHDPPTKFRIKQKLLQRYQRQIIPATHTQHLKQVKVEVITSKELDYILTATTKTPQSNYLLNNDRFDYLYKNMRDMRLQKESRTPEPRIRYAFEDEHSNVESFPTQKDVSFLDIYRPHSEVKQTIFEAIMQKRIQNRKFLLCPNGRSPHKGEISRAPTRAKVRGEIENEITVSLTPGEQSSSTEEYQHIKLNSKIKFRKIHRHRPQRTQGQGPIDQYGTLYKIIQGPALQVRQNFFPMRRN